MSNIMLLSFFLLQVDFLAPPGRLALGVFYNSSYPMNILLSFLNN